MYSRTSKAVLSCIIVIFCLVGILFVAPGDAQRGSTRPGSKLEEKKDPALSKIRPELSNLAGAFREIRRTADWVAANPNTEEHQLNNTYSIGLQAIERAEKEMAEISKRAGADHPEVMRQKQLYEEAQEYFSTKCASYRKKMIASNRAPKDAYKGSDKEKFKNMILAEWKKAHPDDHILAIRFPEGNWNVIKRKEWNDTNNAWEYINKSILELAVIVKTDEKIATIYPAYINKDNNSGSIEPGVDTKKLSYSPVEMLIENFK